jgi:hypothetical protein
VEFLNTELHAHVTSVILGVGNILFIQDMILARRRYDPKISDQTSEITVLGRSANRREGFNSGTQGRRLAGNLRWAGWKFFSQPTLNFSSQPTLSTTNGASATFWRKVLLR